MLAILNSLIRVYPTFHSQQSCQGQGPLSFWGTIWSGSSLDAILSSLILVDTFCHFQLSDQGLHWHSQQSDQGLHYLPFSVGLLSTLFAILSSLIRVYTICRSQQSDQGLHYWSFLFSSGSTLLAILSSLIRVYTIALLSLQIYQGLHCLPFSVVWSGSTIFPILKILIRFYTVCHFQQYDQGLHYFPFSVWSGSTLFVSLSLIRVYTICHSQKSDQGLHCSPFSAVCSGSTCLPFSTVWSVTTLFDILSLIRIYTIWHS